MLTLSRAQSALLVVDFQTRLMPAIHQGAAAVANARRLIDAAGLLEVPVLFTEQNAKGLGGTIDALAARPGLPGLGLPGPVLHKMTFDACRDGGLASLPNRAEIVVLGCEAHVCVLQTVLGLIEAGRRVFVVQDAVGSRHPESKTVALARMARHGAEVVTAEMVVFEWLGTAADARFREAVQLIK